MSPTTLTIVIFLLSVVVTGFTAFRVGRQWQTLRNIGPQVLIAAVLIVVLMIFALPFAAKVAPLAIGWVFALLVVTAWTFLVGAISTGGINKTK